MLVYDDINNCSSAFEEAKLYGIHSACMAYNIALAVALIYVIGGRVSSSGGGQGGSFPPKLSNFPP